MYVKFFEQILPNVQSKRNPKKIKNLKIYSVDGGLWCSLCGCKQIQQVLGKLNDLGAAELGGAIDAVHEGWSRRCSEGSVMFTPVSRTS